MAQAPQPVFSSVEYLDRWGADPLEEGVFGVIVTLSNGGSAPAGTALTARVLLGATPIAYAAPRQFGTGKVEVPLPAPLVGGSFWVQVQWGAAGADPASLPWAPSLRKAPVVVTGLTVTGGRVDVKAGGNSVTLSWEAKEGPQPNAAFAQLVDSRGKPLSQRPSWGTSGTVALPQRLEPGYLAYLAAGALISGDTGSPVFSIGPYSQPVQVPVAAPQVTRVDYDGTRLSAVWEPPPEPPGPPVAKTSYTLVVLDGGVQVARFDAAAGGGTAVVDDLSTLGSDLALGGAVSYGCIDGPVGAIQALVTKAPTILGVKTASATAGEQEVGVTMLEPSQLPSTSVVLAEVVQDGERPVASAKVTSGSAALTYTPVPGHAYSVVARGVIEESKNVVASGPPSAELPLLLGSPTQLRGAYDGERLQLAWDPVADPHLTGYRVAIGGSLAAAYETGPEPSLSLPAPGLGIGTSLSVTVTPLAGAVAGAPAALSYEIPKPAAPAIEWVAADGEEVTVNWSASSGPWFDGYVVTATATATATGSVAEGDAGPAPVSAYTGFETSATLRLPAQESACEWTLTVAARAGGQAGPPSTVVKLIPVVAAVTAVTSDGSTARVSWECPTWPSTVQPPLNSAHLEVQILDGDDVVAVKYAAPAAKGETSVALPAATTGRLSAAARLVAAEQAGSRSGAVPVLASAPAIVFGALLGDSLQLQWSPSPDAGVAAYEVCCGTVRAQTSETQISLPLAGAQPGDVTVKPVAPGATGPAAGQKVVSGCGIGSGSYAEGRLTVALTPAGSPAPDEIWVEALVGGELAQRSRVESSSTSATLEVDLPPGAPASVRATGVGAGSLAPPSAARAIPTSTPEGVRAVYDGTRLHVAWDPVRDPGVTGYLVTVAGAQPDVEPQYVAGAETSEYAAAVTLPAPFPGSATVLVQASVAFDSARIDGPAGAAVAPALAGSVRAVSAPAGSVGQPPYLYRRGAFATPAEELDKELAISLPNPFAEGTPTVEDAETNPTFILSPYASPAPGAPAYLLTVAPRAWSFDGTAARAALRGKYRDLLRAVDAKGVKPGGIALVRQAVATVLPQTFDETLYYRYGLWRDDAPPATSPLTGSASSVTLRAVDLEAGMRLRVSGAAFQNTPAPSGDSRNGYVVVGAETYDLGQVFPAGTDEAGLAPALSVDAFLSRLFLGGAGGSETIVAGPIDFFGPGARQACFRLFYPGQFPLSTGAGSLEPTGNVAVVGAPGWKALEEATDYYHDHGSFPPGGSNLFVAYFRGRATLTPLVAVTVDGIPRWVPLGTTVRDLLAAEGSPVLGAVAPGSPPGIALSRVTAGVFDSALGGEPLRRDAVDLSGADLGIATPALWPLDLPVLGGDDVRMDAWEPPIAGPA